MARAAGERPRKVPGGLEGWGCWGLRGTGQGGRKAERAPAERPLPPCPCLGRGDQSRAWGHELGSPPPECQEGGGALPGARPVEPEAGGGRAREGAGGRGCAGAAGCPPPAGPSPRGQCRITSRPHAVSPQPGSGSLWNPCKRANLPGSDVPPSSAMGPGVSSGLCALCHGAFPRAPGAVTVAPPLHAEGSQSQRGQGPPCRGPCVGAAGRGWWVITGRVPDPMYGHLVTSLGPQSGDRSGCTGLAPTAHSALLTMVGIQTQGCRCFQEERPEEGRAPRPGAPAQHTGCLVSLHPSSRTCPLVLRLQPPQVGGWPGSCGSPPPPHNSPLGPHPAPCTPQGGPAHQPGGEGRQR